MENFQSALDEYLHRLAEGDRISDMIDRIEGCIDTAAEIMAAKNIDPDEMCPDDYHVFAQDALQFFWGKHFRLNKIYNLDEADLRTITPPTRAEIEDAVDEYLQSQNVTYG